MGVWMDYDLYNGPMVVFECCQPVPADHHHPGHRSPLGVHLAVHSVGQDTGLNQKYIVNDSHL